MEFIIYLIIGLIIGFLFGKFWIESQLKLKYQKQLRQIENQWNEEKLKYAQTQSDLNTEKQLNKLVNDQLKDTFETLATKVSRSNNQTFIELAKETMNGLIVKAEEDYSRRSESINDMVKPLKESLEKHEKLVVDFQKGNNEAIRSLKNYLEELGKSQKSLEKETGALVTALKSPKVRGRWGEIGLKRIVEFSGMSHYCDFDEQVSTNTEEGQMRPDMIVNLPGNRRIIVDSKVPLNAYLNALESENDLDKKQLLKDHAKAVATHMKSLSAKAYWSQFDDSIDFVVLYIEVESAFSAALGENHHLIIEGLKNRIVYATPTTLISLLQTVAFSWKQQKAGKNAHKIIQSSRDLQERIASFNESLNKIGQNLNVLVKTYNQSIGSWEGRVLPGVKKMEELGVKAEKKKLKELTQIDRNIRELKQS
ncbi:MAG: DNA recombination protein RmuC [Bacteroidetes bacterium]|nr:MAG: DNA recombination protein RmuC [Bacteroidota bacterium]